MLVVTLSLMPCLGAMPSTTYNTGGPLVLRGHLCYFHQKLTSDHICYVVIYVMTQVTNNISRRRYPEAPHDFPRYLPRPLRIPQENKGLDFNIQGDVLPMFSTDPASDGLRFILQMPGAGDGLSTRLSDRILNLRFQMRGFLEGPQRVNSGQAVSGAVDLYFIYDKSPGGIAPLPGHIFSMPTLTDSLTGLFSNPSTRDRFEFLYRFRYPICRRATSSGTTDNTIMPSNPYPSDYLLIDEDLEINRVTSFDYSGGGGIAAIQAGALYIWLVTSFNTGGGPLYCPQVNLNCRLQFADL